MRNTNIFKILGIIVIIAVIGFSFVTCDLPLGDEETGENNSTTGGNGNNPDGDGNKKGDDGINHSDPFKVYSAAGWDNVRSIIRDGGSNQNYTITITGDFSVPGRNYGLSGTFDRSNLTITIVGNSTISLSSRGALIDTGSYSENTVIIKDVTLKGFAANDSPVVFVGGTFRMEGNSSVTGNTNSYTLAYGSAGGVSVEGTFIMKDNASVSGNNSNSSGSYAGGGGVRVNGGAFIMQDNASVANNTSQSKGGGVLVNGSTTSGNFTMQDNSTVLGNHAVNDGGGIMVGCYGAITHETFTMQGGTISGNSSGSYGGGVCSGRGGTITKTGGIIYGKDEGANSNSASIQGDAVCRGTLRSVGSVSLEDYRNATAGQGVNSGNADFWLND